MRNGERGPGTEKVILPLVREAIRAESPSLSSSDSIPRSRSDAAEVHKIPAAVPEAEHPVLLFVFVCSDEVSLLIFFPVIFCLSFFSSARKRRERCFQLLRKVRSVSRFSSFFTPVYSRQSVYPVSLLCHRRKYSSSVPKWKIIYKI